MVGSRLLLVACAALGAVLVVGFGAKVFARYEELSAFLGMYDVSQAVLSTAVWYVLGLALAVLLTLLALRLLGTAFGSRKALAHPLLRTLPLLVALVALVGSLAVLGTVWGSSSASSSSSTAPLQYVAAFFSEWIAEWAAGLIALLGLTVVALVLYCTSRRPTQASSAGTR